MRMRIVSMLAALVAIVAGLLIAQPANATIGCAVNPACLDVYNEQAGSGLVLQATSMNPHVKVVLASRNRQSALQDFRIDWWSTVKSVSDGDAVDYPFDDPELNHRYHGQPVYRLAFTPNGHSANLYAGINNGGLRLEQFGQFMSPQRNRNLWVIAADMPQMSGGSAAINVGRTNEKGDLKVLTIHSGAGAGTNPFAYGSDADNLYQFPENQTWLARSNYP